MTCGLVWLLGRFIAVFGNMMLLDLADPALDPRPYKPSAVLDLVL